MMIAQPGKAVVEVTARLPEVMVHEAAVAVSHHLMAQTVTVKIAMFDIPNMPMAGMSVPVEAMRTVGSMRTMSAMSAMGAMRTVRSMRTVGSTRTRGCHAYHA